MAKKKILVIGSSNTDMVISMPHLPAPGETILGGEFRTAAGGKGANQAVGAVRAGGDVTFLTCLGKDNFGDEAMKGFIKENLDVRHVVRTSAAPSGIALIFVSERGENSIAVASGANHKLSSRDITKAVEAFTGAGLVVVQLETPLSTVKTAITLAAQKGIPVILNPAPAQALPDGLLRNLSILTPNETEAELLTGVRIKGIDTATTAARALLKRGVKTVVLTLGRRGALVATRESIDHVPGFTVKAVDTTAAGDVFNGALAVALVEGKALLEAVRFGNAAAALSVTQKGAQPSAPTRREIEKFLKIHG